jgi:hypothetical protein
VKIPTKIKVGKKKYDVSKIKQIPGCRGRIYYGGQQILIATHGTGGYKFTKKQMYNTFWHELTHAILDDMGSNLEKDEKFVSNFADRLTDAITSARFEP